MGLVSALQEGGQKAQETLKQLRGASTVDLPQGVEAP